MKKAVVWGATLACILLLGQEAQAQCASGFGISVCGQIYVNPPPVVVAPPPVIYTPPQPVYIPPPVVYAPPPPPVVYIPPPPPPPVYLAPAPVVEVPVAVPVQVVARPFVRHRGLGFGLRASAAYAGISDVGMFGAGGLLRYTATPRLGLELTVDGFGGRGYEGAERVEFPITLNGLWFLNPRSHVQLYLLAGLGLSVAEVKQYGQTDDPVYGGGQLGFGIEFLLGNHVGLTLDVRGFLRGRMNDREADIVAHDGSCRTGADGTLECTDLEAGATFNAGFNFYL